jgi:hypothetical protein
MTLHIAGASACRDFAETFGAFRPTATEPPATSSPKLRQRFTDRESPDSARSRNASHASSRRAAKLFVLIRAWGRARSAAARAE